MADELQANLQNMVVKHPDCFESRKLLKAILTDYLPENKLHINLILNAYDEGIVDQLNTAYDVTLRALQLVKIFVSTYGVAEDLAIWAVTSWCAMLGKNEIAEAISSIKHSSAKPQEPTTQSYVFEHGIYLAGTDFPAGDIKLSTEAPKKNKEIYYAILKKGSNANEIITNGFFKSQAHLSIYVGQRLEIQNRVVLTVVKGVF